MKNIKTLLVIIGLAATCVAAKAQVYVETHPISLTLVTNAQTQTFINTTGQTNTITTNGLISSVTGAGQVDSGYPANVFRIQAGEPLSFKCITVNTDATAAVVTFVLKTTTSKSPPTTATHWDNVNKTTFGVTCNSGTQCTVTNFTYASFGGANWGAIASVSTTHTNSTRVDVYAGAYSGRKVDQ